MTIGSSASPGMTAQRPGLADELGDLLAEAPSFEGALRTGLAFIAQALDRLGAGLVLPRPVGERPGRQVWEWHGHPAPSDSVLERLGDAWETTSCLPPEHGLCLAAHQSLRWEGGDLLVLGDPLDAAGRETLASLIRTLDRTVRQHALHAAGPTCSQDHAALSRIAATLTSSNHFEDILAATMDGFREIMNVEAGCLWLLDESQSELVFKRTWTGGLTWSLEVGSQVGPGLVGECIRGQAGRCVNDVTQDGRSQPQADGATGLQVRSVLCAPLVANGRALGAIELLNKKIGWFDAHDEELLASMAACVANAMENARLIHQLTLANADLEASRWEVLRSRSTLQALFDGITVPIYIVDRSYNLVAVNQACARRCGCAQPDLLGRLCYEELWQRKEACPGCRTGETLFSGVCTQRTERRWIALEEPDTWLVNTYPILDEGNRPLQAIVLEQDVTEKRRLEASLAQSEKLAAVGQLAAGVAHEINNPLAAIIANCQLLQREIPSEDNRRECVDLIAQAGVRAMRVVRNLLDFARQDVYEMVPTDINESITNAVSLVQHQLHTSSINLSLDLADDLLPVRGSRDHLQSVWLNLLLNARDALSGASGEVQIITRRQGDTLQVVVADTGMGIPAERLSRIFEPFHTTKSPGQGTGLGLSACHRIIKQHGGEIRVESTPGSGTQFIVSLPADNLRSVTQEVSPVLRKPLQAPPTCKPGIGRHRVEVRR
jgi:signal transduction histidine kinase/putative methionine-R-sulfoxide reductase with GAF domain